MGDCTYCGKRRINFNQDEDHIMRIENNERGDYFIATGELMIDSVPISFCPFCGGPAEFAYGGYWEGELFKVKCSNKDKCVILPETGAYFIKQQAAAAWNRRVND
uniref:Lar family restriction alleviation protein n=1 Tax=Collinsella aerofaciens TaxID=74426 RepID=UPI0012DC45E3|nr:Lar family restriction alleviation protein [Collinsella aerofaciens]